MSDKENKEQIDTKKEIIVQKTEKKLNKKKFFISLSVFVLVIYSIYIYILSRPLITENFYCSYSNKFNKITCTQTGDVVPPWLQLDNNQYLMKLIIYHDNKNYRVLNMVDKEFIVDMNRKFIYELKEQTFFDWIDFKKYLYNAKTNNWGSVILYCSENNLTENICKQMKKQYKK